jgi:hypothetical protein
MLIQKYNKNNTGMLWFCPRISMSLRFSSNQNLYKPEVSKKFLQWNNFLTVEWNHAI